MLIALFCVVSPFSSGSVSFTVLYYEWNTHKWQSKVQLFWLSPVCIHALAGLVYFAYLFSHSRSKLPFATLLLLSCFPIFDRILACIHLSTQQLLYSLQIYIYILSIKRRECFPCFLSFIFCFLLALPSSSARVKAIVVPREEIYESHFRNRKKISFLLKSSPFQYINVWWLDKYTMLISHSSNVEKFFETISNISFFVIEVIWSEIAYLNLIKYIW